MIRKKKIQKHKLRKHESGNILVYILGAIFLIGLLIIMVRGSNTPGAGIDHEALMIRVSEVQEYGNELERAVAYVLRNGHSEVDIRFAHPNAASAYGIITDDPTRQIFDAQGGGATYRDPPQNIQTAVTPWLFSGDNRIFGIGVDIAVSSSELTAILQNVTKEFCLLVNEKNGITNPSDSPPQDSVNINLTTLFTGVYPPAGGNMIGDNVTRHNFGKAEGCLEGDVSPPAGTYHYYRVLLAR